MSVYLRKSMASFVRGVLKKLEQMGPLREKRHQKLRNGRKVLSLVEIVIVFVSAFFNYFEMNEPN